MRVAPGEFRQCREHHQPPDRRRHLDPQRAFGLTGAEQPLRFFQVSQQADATLVIGRTIEGRADLTGGAVQQLHAQVGFKLFDQHRH